jgi:CCR4-NOT transcription complex subunit 1
LPLILKIIENQGFEAERHLYRCLFSNIDFNSEVTSINNTTSSSSSSSTTSTAATTSSSNKSSGKDIHQIQYLKECLPVLLSKSYCITILTFAINNPLQFQEVVEIN